MNRRAASPGPGAHVPALGSTFADGVLAAAARTAHPAPARQLPASGTCWSHGVGGWQGGRCLALAQARHLRLMSRPHPAASHGGLAWLSHAPGLRGSDRAWAALPQKACDNGLAFCFPVQCHSLDLPPPLPRLREYPPHVLPARRGIRGGCWGNPDEIRSRNTAKDSHLRETSVLPGASYLSASDGPAPAVSWAPCPELPPHPTLGHITGSYDGASAPPHAGSRG